VHTGTLQPVRILAVACAVALALACSDPPVVPLERSYLIAVDVQPATWAIGWTMPTHDFSDSLRTELARYKIDVVERGMPAEMVAQVDLGLWNNWRAIDVAIARGGKTVHVGRVTVPDLSMTTLDVAARMVASIIARGITSTTPMTEPSVLPDNAVDGG
jgi:hypothetical protein